MMDDFDRVQMAFDNILERPPAIETTVDGQLTFADMRMEIADGYAKGLTVPEIEQAFLPNKHPPAVVGEARRQLEERLRYPDWSRKLQANDRAVVQEWQRLSLKARPRADEAPWTPGLR